MKWLEALRDRLFTPRKILLTKERRTTVIGKQPSKFEELINQISALNDQYLLDHENVSLNFHIRCTSGGVVQEAGIVMCPACGSKNRLSRGFKGALCGACKCNLEVIFN